ncbi:MAG: DUF4340 domain-containing protein [Planctomycetaceae bacterium]
MSESARTLAYAGVAVASVVIAGVYGWATAPDRVDGFDNVGKEFYPDFLNPSEADSLRVVAFNEDTATIRQFAVARQESGQWVIPTHNDYPADAREQLNKTANSIIGIKRGAQKGTRQNEHKEFGVLDPLVKEGDFDGRGKRITLKKGDEVLADYIIGKKVEDEGNLFYVRIPKQNEVYLAELNVELSTKFSDWIETDLLKINKSDLREVSVNKYSIDEQRGNLTDQELSVLKRETSTSDWTLEGLKEETEELKTTEVDSLVDALDELTIVGVRPKPKGLNADLTVDMKYVKSQMQLQQIQIELQSKGFFISPGGEDKPARLLANEGNVIAATEDGLVYTLNFGELFGGSLDEIEIGEDAKKDDGESKNDASMNNANNRYLFVSVAFDENYLGEKPTEPAKPTKPEGLIDPAEVEKQDENAEPGEDDKEEADAGCGLIEQEEQEAKQGETSEQEPSKEKAGDDSKEQDKPKPESAEDKQKRLQGEWDTAQRDYEKQLKDYEAELKTYNDKIAEGKKKVDELNYRLGAWYYVISGESFETLRLARADLVKAKEKKPEDSPAAPAIPAGAATQPPAPKAEAKPADKPVEAPAAVPAKDENKAEPAAEPGEPEAAKKKPESSEKAASETKEAEGDKKKAAEDEKSK